MYNNIRGSRYLVPTYKGPMGFILPLLVRLICFVFSKRLGGIRSMRLLSGMALFFVIVLSWYLPALLKGGEEFKEYKEIFQDTMVIGA